MLTIPVKEQAREQVPAPCPTVQIEQAIRTATGSLIRGLQIVSEADQMTIHGSTKLFYHKQLATRAAQEVWKGPHLHNHIRVSPKE